MLALVVSGDRHATHERWSEPVFHRIRKLESRYGPGGVVIVGDATGIDQMVRTADRRDIAELEVLELVAPWKRYGRAAGPMRNEAMLQVASILQQYGYTTHVLVCHDNLYHQSKGTRQLAETAQRLGFTVTHLTSDGRTRDMTIVKGDNPDQLSF